MVTRGEVETSSSASDEHSLVSKAAVVFFLQDASVATADDFALLDEINSSRTLTTYGRASVHSHLYQIISFSWRSQKQNLCFENFFFPVLPWELSTVWSRDLSEVLESQRDRYRAFFSLTQVKHPADDFQIIKGKLEAVRRQGHEQNSSTTLLQFTTILLERQGAHSELYSMFFSGSADVWKRLFW